LPRSRNEHDAIVVWVDKLSKMMHCAPTTTTISAPALAQLTFKEVVRHHGLPATIVSDRDPRFTSHFWRSLWAQTGTKLAMSTAYHPQTDGQTERANHTLEDMLRAYVSDRQDDWDEHLVTAEMAYNNSVQASTGFTPYYLNSGQHPTLPMSASLPISSSSPSVVNPPDNPAAASLVSHLYTDLDKARTNLIAAQERQAKYADEGRREETFKVGDRVWLSTTHMVQTGKTPKLSARYTGPFPVCQVVSPSAYKLSLPRSLRIHPVFHISRLRRHMDSVSQFPLREQDVRPPPDLLESGEEAWEVERVVDKREKRVGRRKQTEYLVLWKGYPEWEKTWEPASNLKNAREAVQAYNNTTQHTQHMRQQ
jgi:hypothetical protein